MYEKYAMSHYQCTQNGWANFPSQISVYSTYSREISKLDLSKYLYIVQSFVISCNRWSAENQLYIYDRIEDIRKHLWHIYHTCICAIYIDEIINEYIRKVG